MFERNTSHHPITRMHAGPESRQNGLNRKWQLNRPNIRLKKHTDMQMKRDMIAVDYKVLQLRDLLTFCWKTLSTGLNAK